MQLFQSAISPLIDLVSENNFSIIVCWLPFELALSLLTLLCSGLGAAG